jgi:hypothetical protein
MIKSKKRLIIAVIEYKTCIFTVHDRLFAGQVFCKIKVRENGDKDDEA